MRWVAVLNSGRDCRVEVGRVGEKAAMKVEDLSVMGLDLWMAGEEDGGVEEVECAGESDLARFEAILSVKLSESAFYQAREICSKNSLLLNCLKKRKGPSTPSLSRLCYGKRIMPQSNRTLDFSADKTCTQSRLNHA